jgi:hypothetical protein
VKNKMRDFQKAVLNGNELRGKVRMKKDNK